MKRKARPKRRNVAVRVALLLLALAVLAGAAWCRWVYVQIETYANQDQAAPSDAIAVFGARSTTGSHRRSIVRGWTMRLNSTIARSRR